MENEIKNVTVNVLSKNCNSLILSKLQEFTKERKEKCTSSEFKFQLLLESIGIPYEKEKPFYFTKKNVYIVDFYIPSLKQIIEIDGGYHNTKSQWQYDYRRDKWFRKNGYSISRITNEMVDCLYKLLETKLDCGKLNK